MPNDPSYIGDGKAATEMAPASESTTDGHIRALHLKLIAHLLPRENGAGGCVGLLCAVSLVKVCRKHRQLPKTKLSQLSVIPKSLEEMGGYVLCVARLGS